MFVRTHSAGRGSSRIQRIRDARGELRGDRQGALFADVDEAGRQLAQPGYAFAPGEASLPADRGLPWRGATLLNNESLGLRRRAEHDALPLVRGVAPPPGPGLRFARDPRSRRYSPQTRNVSSIDSRLNEPVASPATAASLCLPLESTGQRNPRFPWAAASYASAGRVATVQVRLDPVVGRVHLDLMGGAGVVQPQRVAELVDRHGAQVVIRSAPDPAGKGARGSSGRVGCGLELEAMVGHM